MTAPPPSPQHPQAGFSLLEVMVSVALGAIIMATVYAGFRVSTQTITVCNRLSLENRLLTAGVARALDDIDFWDSFDRPDWQPCRTPASKAILDGEYASNGSDSSQLPQPFTAFRDSWVSAKNGVSPAKSTYDPLWLPHDTRTWYRGHGALVFHPPTIRGRGTDWGMASQNVDDSVWGNYGIFSNTALSINQRGTGSVDVGKLTGGDFPSGDPQWYGSQQKGLKYALGFYGWWDYVPANAILDWYESPSSFGGRTTLPYELRTRYWGSPDRRGSSHVDSRVDNIGRFALWTQVAWSSQPDRPNTRSSHLWETTLGIAAPRSPTDTPDTTPDDVNSVLRINRWMGGSRPFGWEHETAINLLNREIARPVGLVKIRPEHWPKVTSEVRRYRVFARTINQCHVRMFDPLTTKMVEVDFRTIGTTLRGARLQRKPGASTSARETLDD